MRILNRPMFRLGGSTGQGITSGLRRQGYQFGERVTTEDILKSYGPAPRRTNVYDFLTDWGLRMASATPSGNVIQTAAKEAREPYAQFTKGKGEAETLAYAMRAKAADTARAENLALGKMEYGKERDIADREMQWKIAELEAQGEKQFMEKQINAYWDPIIEEETDPTKKKELQKEKDKEKYKIIVEGWDVSDEYKLLTNEAAYSQAITFAENEIGNTINSKTKANWLETDAGYSEKLQRLINKYLRLASQFLEEDKKGKAKGGRVGYQNAGPVTSLPNQGSPSLMAKAATDTEVEDAFGVSVEEAAPETKEINISYEQLRNRLPPEIKDEIVLLLSQSYEAFADFAEIQTQADVNEFNIKYNVQLFLPQQTGV